MKKIFKSKKGSGLTEKIMLGAFAVAMGGAVIVWTSHVIIEAKDKGISGLLNESGYIDTIDESEGTSGLQYGAVPCACAYGGDPPATEFVYGYSGTSPIVKVPTTHGTQTLVESCNLPDGANWETDHDQYCKVPKTVTGIKYNAFEGNETITTVALPNSAKTIGNSAFRNCHNLSQVVISSSTGGIGSYAFACTSITSINIPSSCGVVGENAFLGCPDNLVINVDLPSKPTQWADNWNAGHTVNWNGSSMPNSFEYAGPLNDPWENMPVGPAVPAEPAPGTGEGTTPEPGTGGTTPEPGTGGGTTNPQTEYAVWLTSSGPQKIQCIKLVREITGLGLKEAKDLVDSCPRIIKEGLSQSAAQDIIDRFTEIEATAEMRH